jgi:hypothetical protein
VKGLTVLSRLQPLLNKSSNYSLIPKNHNTPTVLPSQCPSTPKPLAVTCLPEVHEDQEAKGNETAHYYTVPPLLVAYPADQTVDTRHLASRSDYATVDASERLPLDTELLIDSVCLREDCVCHVVTVVYATAFI